MFQAQLQWIRSSPHSAGEVSGELGASNEANEEEATSTPLRGDRV